MEHPFKVIGAPGDHPYSPPLGLALDIVYEISGYEKCARAIAVIATPAVAEAVHIVCGFVRAVKMAKRAQPAWSPPAEKDKPILKLYNSLTRKKEIFVPKNGNNVSWYSCGPTVYDASHMGHARSYISFDILRRVMSDYFGYNILYVMNITDIDDKIIKRARQDYLYEKYLKEGKSLEQILDDAYAFSQEFENDLKGVTDPDKKTMLFKIFNEMSDALESVKMAVKLSDGSETDKMNAFLRAAKVPISQWLDRKLGSSVKDNSIFMDLPRYWEKEFQKDMKALNVLPPDVLTRVSEYIPEIITFIENIIKNGLGYVANNSVYFNVGEFDKRENHYYAKLVPEAYGDTNSLLEGEGDLTTEFAEKRSPNDFALWKCSKSGEPSWDSPWGLGRPGWHIECSAMASAICGDSLDIHTGGVDLKFPHHDNELAQSEAHFDNSGWVSYFLHTGHLTISGCKMSKSLKNFITIQEALEKNSAVQLRLAFLLHSWKDTLDYSPSTLEMAIQYEKMLNEFFLSVKDAIRCGMGIDQGGFWQEPESKLYNKLTSTQDLVHKYLCDNIDTRSVLDVIRELVSATNVYLKCKNGPANSLQAPSAILLERVGKYVTKLFQIFGAIDASTGIGFPIRQNVDNDYESVVMPYLDAIASFRQSVRNVAKTAKVSEILTLCDILRDDTLPSLGVRLEDKEDRYVVKLCSPEQLIKEKEEKLGIEAEKKAEKERKKQEQLALEKLKEEQKKISPTEMFKMETDKYSIFDDKGLPTHDHSGQELSKGLIKKLQKLQIAQDKKYNEYISSVKK